MWSAWIGGELTDDNVWVHQRRREVASLDAIIGRLQAPDAAGEYVAGIGGAGTANRGPTLRVSTRGSHESVLHKADPGTPRH